MTILFKQYKTMFSLLLYDVRNSRAIAANTKSRHCFHSWARCHHLRSLYPISLRSILIFSSHLCLCLPNGLFPLGLPINTFYGVRFSSKRATWSAHPHRRDLPKLILSGPLYNWCNATLCNFLHLTVSLSRFAPIIFWSILFSNTLNFFSFCNYALYP